MKRCLALFVALGAVLCIGAKGCEIQPPGEPIPDTAHAAPVCDDLFDKDFGDCEMLMGFGVVDGECRVISGCGATDVALFDTWTRCDKKCIRPHAECDELERKYFATLKEHQSCGCQDDCRAIMGHCGVSLGGCYEPVSDPSVADPLAKIAALYAELGCTGAVCSCVPEAPPVACVEGTCTFVEPEPQPTCRDFKNVDLGPCDQFLGYGVYDGECSSISGCGSQGYAFFESQAACRERCDPKPNCRDLTHEYFGPCEWHLGFGVAGDECAPIGGCDSGDIELFETRWDCERKCFDRPWCQRDLDCELYADYCGGCHCRARPTDAQVLAVTEFEIPESMCLDQVYCFADPCMNRVPLCRDGVCVVSDYGESSP